MADVHSPETRSYNMSRIRGKDTKPEMIVRKFLFSKGFRYRLHDKRLPGKPDIVLPKYKTVIFINGCFWHGHMFCKDSHIPKTNSEFWFNKIRNTQKRDQKAEKELNSLQWKVLKIWECQITKETLKSVIIEIIKE